MKFRSRALPALLSVTMLMSLTPMAAYAANAGGGGPSKH